MILTANTAYAQSGCTDATLTGNYAVLGPGIPHPNFVTPASQHIPFAIVGVLAFDGTGNVSFTFTFANNGLILQGPYQLRDLYREFRLHRLNSIYGRRCRWSNIQPELCTLL